MRPPFEGSNNGPSDGSNDADTVELNREGADRGGGAATVAGGGADAGQNGRAAADGGRGASVAGNGQRKPVTGDRQAHKGAVRSFRSRRTVAATLVAAVIAVVTILLAIEVISRLAGNPLNLFPAGDLAELGRETQWNDPLPVIVAVLVGLLGLFLLALAFLPGRSRVIPVDPHREHSTLVLRPVTVERQAIRAAEGVPGVDHAEAHTRRDTLRVRAHSTLREPGDLAEQVRDAVAERVAAMQPLRQPRLTVDLRHEKE